ncbi:beta-propeller fold lactonase family protein [Buchnera aphidicola]|uniref:beta-propeller fold lactonase family protein n=1 Tax=Buchnera aphidicola TaxID=9 RepID=UPI002238D2A4|nr:beta-propeller fold lactonase family protein [Buchnera aphidicola]MCW5197697.1 beta-propeller fold lactonase family protein [Buchnera aphidicola (Chaitophorus viminalis)]
MKKKYIIYVSIPKKNIIEVFEFNLLKKVKKIQEISTNKEIQPIKVSIKKKKLYAGIRNNAKIITYDINNQGLLKKNSQIKTYGNPNHIYIDKNEKYLFNSSYGNNSISCHLLDKNGIPKKIYKLKNKILGCHASIIDKSNKFLFFTALKLNKIFIYNIENIKKLFKINVNKIYHKKNYGPRHLSIHPNNKYLYILNELNSTITVWNIKNIIYQNKNKYIQKINITPIFFKKKWAADIHISPCGLFLYASERATHTISLFQINPNTGKIKFLKIYKTEKQPRSFTIDKTGKYIIVVGQKSNSASIYSINKKNGFLNKKLSFITMQEPLWVETLLLKS